MSEDCSESLWKWSDLIINILKVWLTIGWMIAGLASLWDTNIAQDVTYFVIEIILTILGTFIHFWEVMVMALIKDGGYDKNDHGIMLWWIYPLFFGTLYYKK